MRADHCGPETRRPYKCPNRDDLFRAFMLLLPRGRAWQTHDAGVPRDQSWLQRYWWAVAGESEVFWQSICSMIDQYFCDTVTYMRDELLADYGLPDECDPYGDICTKIAAYGDYGCAYYVHVAAAAGWTVSCFTYQAQECCNRVGHMRAGHAECSSAPSWLNSKLFIVVDLDNSPAYEPDPCRNNCVGQMRVGYARPCNDSYLGLLCLLDKIVPAHVDLDVSVEPQVGVAPSGAMITSINPLGGGLSAKASTGLMTTNGNP